MSNSNLRALAATTFLNKGGRPSQEDYLLVDREKGIFVVADGFGGPVPGAEAAKISCESVRNFLFKEAGDLDATLPFELRQYFSLAGNVLFNSLVYANRKLTAFNKGRSIHEKGGASVLATFIDGDLLAVANIGLCTAKLLRKGQVAELVIPRSYGRMQDPFSAYSNFDWRVPMTALGMTESIEPEIFEYRLNRGDWLVLCSDGITPEANELLLHLQATCVEPERVMNEFSKSMNLLKFRDNIAVSLMIF